MELKLTQPFIEMLHPFFLAINCKGKVVAFGKSAKKCFTDIKIESDILDICLIVKPINAIELFKNGKISEKVISLKSKTTDIIFNGEIIGPTDDSVYFIAINPVIENSEYLVKHSLSISDFSSYSPFFDFYILTLAEKFARVEQNKSFNELKEQINFAEINLKIANFCSQCSEINEAIDFVIKNLSEAFSWNSTVSELIDPQELQEEIKIENSIITVMLRNNLSTRRILTFESTVAIKVSESLKVFIRSLRVTLENFIVRIEQQQSIQEANAHNVASSKMNSLGEMAAGIAHELNNPLMIIKGKARSTLIKIQKLDFKNEDIIENQKKILAMTDRCGKIIRVLSTYSRDAAQDPMELFELNKILSETLELCQEKLSNRNIKLELPSAGSHVILGRPVQISQVLLNLINNAADAIENDINPWINIKIDKIDHNWQISVIDSGKGISQKNIDKIMSPFFTTKAPGKGTGLGLSICNSILKDHGGNFWYNQKVENTCFSFTLPIREMGIDKMVLGKKG